MNTSSHTSMGVTCKGGNIFRIIAIKIAELFQANLIILLEEFKHLQKNEQIDHGRMQSSVAH